MEYQHSLHYLECAKKKHATKVQLLLSLQNILFAVLVRCWLQANWWKLQKCFVNYSISQVRYRNCDIKITILSVRYNFQMKWRYYFWRYSCCDIVLHISKTVVFGLFVVTILKFARVEFLKNFLTLKKVQFTAEQQYQKINAKNYYKITQNNDQQRYIWKANI